MVASKLLVLVLPALAIAMPAIQQKRSPLAERFREKLTMSTAVGGSDVSIPEIDSIVVPGVNASLLTKRAPYPLTCNNENIIFEDGQACYQELHRKGNEGKMCGASKLCEKGTTKVSGSLWQTKDKNFKVNCGLAADALNAIWTTCGKRGGKYSTPCWRFCPELIRIQDLLACIRSQDGLRTVSICWSFT